MQNRIYSIELNTLSPHLVWIIPILEILAVPLVVLLHQTMPSAAPKAPWHGWLAGMAATACLLLILNHFLPQMHFRIQEQPLLRIPVVMPSIWGGFFLATIFAVQRAVPRHMFSNYWANGAALGFLALVIPTLAVGTVYVVITRLLPHSAITLVTDAPIRLRTMHWLRLSICLGIYEAVAFPLINIWQSMPDHQVLWGALWGGIGGLGGIGTTIGLYSLLPFLKIRLQFLAANTDLK